MPTAMLKLTLVTGSTLSVLIAEMICVRFSGGGAAATPADGAAPVVAEAAGVLVSDAVAPERLVSVAVLVEGFVSVVADDLVSEPVAEPLADPLAEPLADGFASPFPVSALTSAPAFISPDAELRIAGDWVWAWGAAFMPAFGEGVAGDGAAAGRCDGDGTSDF